MIRAGRPTPGGGVPDWMSLPVPQWGPPSARDIAGWPLPCPEADGNRWLVRAASLIARPRITAIHGLENIMPDRDPFILAFNHGTRREAVFVPAVLMLLRGGKVIHFLADWNFRLIPGVGMVLKRSGTITVTTKSAKPAILNILKPLFRHDRSPVQRAMEFLRDGSAIGIFPEGKVNRNPRTLTAGRTGMARMSLRAGVPVVPGGIRYPGVAAGAPVPENTSFEIHMGEPLVPEGRAVADPPPEAVRHWHAVLMSEIARLSGREWIPATAETSHGP